MVQGNDCTLVWSANNKASIGDAGKQSLVILEVSSQVLEEEVEKDGVRAKAGILQECTPCQTARQHLQVLNLFSLLSSSVMLNARMAKIVSCTIWYQDFRAVQPWVSPFGKRILARQPLL
jgi:hypothetical protein